MQSFFVTLFNAYFAHLLQEDSALFTASIDMEETYDAFDRDIALVSFYFKNPTVFEYIR